MEVLYSINQSELLANLQKMENAVEVESLIILMTDDGVCNPIFMNPLLADLKKPIIGGVFEEIIVKSERKNIGALVFPLPFVLKTEIFEFQLGSTSSFEKMKTVFTENSAPSGSIYIFEDAFADGKTTFVENLFNFFGFRFAYLGAGCGTFAFKSFPCVIHNSGIFANAAVIGLTSEPVSLGIAHGWSPISVPMKVTEVEDCKVINIDWEPAFDAYKRIVETHSGRIFDETNFLDLVKSYPLGLVKIDGDFVIRDMMRLENGSLHFFDKIDIGQYVCVLNGNINSLLVAAGKAKDNCIGSNDKIVKNGEYVFCIDCMSRVNFLEESFIYELEEISGGQSVYGALTFGEIANIGDSCIEIYNKTVIVAKWKQII